MRLGILQRYVLGDVIRSFALAMLTITSVFVLFMVMAEATRMGIPLIDILKLVPYIIPATLPYTTPVSLLFAVSVVYGRLAADNEVTALKAAGVSAWALLWPAVLLGLVIGSGLFVLGRDFIPRCNNQFKRALYSDIEDMFYLWLKKEHQFINPKFPVQIFVWDVEDKILINPTIEHRVAGQDGLQSYDSTVAAERAEVEFDLDAGLVRIYLTNANAMPNSSSRIELDIQGRDVLEFDLPETLLQFQPNKQVQEYTAVEIEQKQAELLDKIRDERQIQAVQAAFRMATGRLTEIRWNEIDSAFNDYEYWEHEFAKLETEKHQRVALAAGVVGFVLLGAPVAIRGAKRDFLSSFMFCFLPIIVGYYPSVLLAINVGKEGIISPMYAMWAGNLGLLVAAGFVLPPVIRH